MHIKLKSIVNIHEQLYFILPTHFTNSFTCAYHTNAKIVSGSPTLNRIVETCTHSAFTNPATRIFQFRYRNYTTKLCHYKTMLFTKLDLLFCPSLDARKCSK